MESCVSCKGFVFGEYFFDTYEDFEEACFDNPSLEELFDEDYYINCVKEDVSFCYLVAEVDCGDGDTDIADMCFCKCMEEN